MTSPQPVGLSRFRARRRRDWLIAASLAVLVLVAGTIVYLTSDIRAVESNTAADQLAPGALATMPQALSPVWEQPTNAAAGAVGSPYGTVVTTDEHGVYGRDVATGQVRWSYIRSNRPLCRIGSADDDPNATYNKPFTPVDSRVFGILAAYGDGTYCGELVLLDPKTGERRFQRTAPNAASGNLIFGGPYAGWVSSDLVELWRGDLYRTIQYGNQPASPEANTARRDCTFGDTAVTERQWAVIAHCPDKGTNSRLVINYTDPDDQGNQQDKDWSVYRNEPRADIDLGAQAAVIVGITRDRVAVLTGDTNPAVLVYDADGNETSRTPVEIPADAVKAAADTNAPLPRLTRNSVQYTLVHDHLIAVGSEVEQVQVTSTPTSTDATATASATPSVSTEDRDSPVVRWVLGDVIGLPAAVGDDLAVPTVAGISVVPAADGTVSRMIGVDRPGNPTRVDVSTVGNFLVEDRGSTVAVLSGEGE